MDSMIYTKTVDGVVYSGDHGDNNNTNDDDIDNRASFNRVS